MLAFRLKPGETSSPREIWDIAERLKLEPVRLMTARQTFTTRPPPEAPRS